MPFIIKFQFFRIAHRLQIGASKDAAEYVRKEAKDAINSFVEDAEKRKLFTKGIKHYSCVKSVNVKDARRRIADKIIEENKYCF